MFKGGDSMEDYVELREEAINEIEDEQNEKYKNIENELIRWDKEIIKNEICTKLASSTKTHYSPKFTKSQIELQKEKLFDSQSAVYTKLEAIIKIKKEYKISDDNS
jgi:hypothetical protein